MYGNNKHTLNEVERFKVVENSFKYCVVVDRRVARCAEHEKILARKRCRIDQHRLFGLFRSEKITKRQSSSDIDLERALRDPEAAANRAKRIVMEK